MTEHRDFSRERQEAIVQMIERLRPSLREWVSQPHTEHSWWTEEQTAHRHCAICGIHPDGSRRCLRAVK